MIPATCVKCGGIIGRRRSDRRPKFCSLACMYASPRDVGRIRPDLLPKGHPSTGDIQWAAGLYEGEGTCRFLRNVSGNSGTTAVAVSQKNRWVLDRLAYLFGGSVRSAMKGSYGPQLTWNATGSLGRGFLMTIYKFLSPWRKTQARMALHVRSEQPRALAL